MEIIRPGTKIDFMGKRKAAFFISVILIIAGIVSLIVHGGPNYGIDFAGGTLVRVKFFQTVEFNNIRTALNDVGLEEGVIQQVGAGEEGEYFIRLELGSSDLAGFTGVINDALTKAFGTEGFEIRSTEMKSMTNTWHS